MPVTMDNVAKVNRWLLRSIGNCTCDVGYGFFCNTIKLIVIAGGDPGAVGGG